MAWTSPRTTQLLHQVGDLEGLLDVGDVVHEPACFGGQPTSAALARCGLSDGLTGGFGARDTSASGDFVQRAQAVGAQAEGEWWRSCRRKPSVERNALQTPRWLAPTFRASLSPTVADAGVWPKPRSVSGNSVSLSGWPPLRATPSVMAATRSRSSEPADPGDLSRRERAAGRRGQRRRAA